jgi:alpha-glucosidase
MLLLCSLRGSITIWQGEELGLPQVDVPFDKLQDPEAIANWPLTLSRDGARTPMPWEAQAPNLGFTNGDPWLPLGSKHVELAIDRQEALDSTLNFTRKCLALRHAHAALLHGSMTILEAGNQLLVFERASGGETLRCTFNLSERPASYRPGGTPLIVACDIDGGSLGPYAAVIEEIA